MERNKKLHFIGIGISIGISIMAILFQYTREKDEAQNGYYVAVAKVLEYRKNRPKGTTTRKHVLKFKYWNGEKFIIKIRNIEIGTYYTDDIVPGDLFILKVSKTNPDLYDIFFNIKVDPEYGVKIP
ncbi:hypothetical protein [Marinifilum fragile]|uniref:hypothetical protein n=1 Tax=Marinifilum fragile TaxID=570161 RepID=UPI002AA892EC|nr:hypothetical protein [Marinifilum fragile]